MLRCIYSKQLFLLIYEKSGALKITWLKMQKTVQIEKLHDDSGFS